MHYPPDRIKASAERATNLCRDKEALAVLSLNDAAARYKQGRFYYLPDCSSPAQQCVDGQLKLESIVPNLFYVHHSWTEAELQTYWRSDGLHRYLCLQDQILAQIEQMEVLPMYLIIPKSGVASLEWPTQSTARIVIYGPGPWYKLSWMTEWIEKASKNKAGDAYKIPMYQRGCFAKKKSIYMKSGNAMGRTRDIADLPEALEKMLGKLIEGGETSVWMKGADIIKIMDHETTEIGNETDLPRGQ